MQGHRAWWLAAVAAILVPGAAAADSFARAESLYAAGQLAPARAAYLEVLATEPAHFRALYRVSRAESELGEDAKGEEQRRLTSAAVEHARAAIAAAPDSAQGHQALREGAKTRLALSREIKSEVDRAIALDPTLGRAYHARALWNRKIASLNFLERAAANTVLGGVPKGASMENAVADLQKAIELEPRYVNHHLELGRTYLEMDRHADARRELEQAVALPATSNPRDPHYQGEARELLKKLPKRE